MKRIETNFLLGLIGACVLFISACGGPPKNNPLLDEARVKLSTASSDSAIVAGAPETLDQAEAALRRSERLLEEGADREEIEHYAYLANQYVAIAEATAGLRSLEKDIESAELERQEVVLRQRELEAEMAKQEAQEERAVADSARVLAEKLAEQLRELEAKQTERGLVLTLSDVLFDVGHATLKEGGHRTVGQLSAFLQQYPERRVLIEGHTDNTGSLELNMDLSRRRAESVKAALLEMGISPDRIATTGFGPTYPVASNDSAAGRQQNRRVEIIISDEEGVISQRGTP